MTSTKTNPKALPLRTKCAITLAAGLGKLLRRTGRLSFRGDADILAGKTDGALICPCWHNRLFLLPTCMPLTYCNQGTALVSASRDGEYAARFLAHFGIDTVCGSTSRHAFRGLVEIKRRMDTGAYVFLTPDGPRGPRYHVAPGVVLLARKTGAPVVPICLNASRRWELKSWDRTQIPKPFARLEFRIADPIPADELRDIPVDDATARVREALLGITDDGDA